MTIEDKINNLFKDQFPEIEKGLAKGEFDWLKTDLVEIVTQEISNALDMIVLEKKNEYWKKHTVERCLGYRNAVDDLESLKSKVKGGL